MPKKRRNGGRSRKGRGKTTQVDCDHCMCKPPKDKAVHRFNSRQIVDAGAMNDLRAASAYEAYTVPKLYAKSYYCISCACHSRIVRVRNRVERRNREAPKRFTRRPEGDRKDGDRKEGDRRGPRKEGDKPAEGAAPAAEAPAAEAATAAV
jgi:small subunit ribosomal protein S26e